MITLILIALLAEAIAITAAVHILNGKIGRIKEVLDCAVTEESAEEYTSILSAASLRESAR